MDTSQFDQRIEAANERLKALREEMAAARDSLAAAIADYASASFEAQVKGAIDENPVRAKELGIDGIRELKSGLADLQASVGEIVQTKFVEKVAWEHERDNPSRSNVWDNPYTTHGSRRVPQIYDEPLRRVLGAAQPLIYDHGLVANASFSASRSDRERYGRALDWPSELQGPGKAYADLWTEFMEVLTAKAEAETAKAKAEAADLWDRA